MSKADTNRVLIGHTTYLQRWHVKQLEEYAKKRGVMLSRLISLAIENELKRDNPFEYSCKLPDKTGALPHTYADEVGKICKYMRRVGSTMDLDVWHMCRHEIGVPDSETFLLAFREAIDDGLIVMINKITKSRKAPRVYVGYKFNPTRV